MKKIAFNDKFGLTQAVLDGRKTITRQIIKAPKKMEGKDCYGFCVVKKPDSDEVTEVFAVDEEGAQINNIVPKYKVGEIVAIAQAYKDIYWNENFVLKNCSNGYVMESSGWRNKMNVMADMMPNKVRITNVHVERLWNISDNDVYKEGFEIVKANNYPYFETGVVCFDGSGSTVKIRSIHPRAAFSILIDKIYGKGTWDSNPYVWVYEFELVKNN